MELQTRLKHIQSEAEFNQILAENEKAMICCGRMGPMCLPAYFKNGQVIKATTSIQNQDQIESILKEHF